MKTNKIYKGVIKEGFIKKLDLSDNIKKYLESHLKLVLDSKETLLYKVNEQEYKDIVGYGKYRKEDIIDESLVPYSRMIDCSNKITKRKCIELYNEKLHEKLALKNLYIGDIGCIYTFDMTKETEDEKNMKIMNVHLKCCPIKENALLLRDNKKYIDLETYIKYNQDKVRAGDFIVISPKPLIECLSNEGLEEKMELEKVLSKYRKNFIAK